MQKIVLKVDVIEDMKSKKKVMRLVSSIPGIESISMDMKDKKLTVIGDMDPISVVTKLRKHYYTDILSIGPAKEPEKPKNEPKKAEEPKPAVVHVNDFVHAMQAYNSYSNPPHLGYNGYYRSVEEDPNACVIC